MKNNIDFSKDYYAILGVSKEASMDDIKKAFRKLSIEWHPDKHSADSDEDKKIAEEKFKEINEAYTVLHDKDARKAYDAGPQSMQDEDLMQKIHEEFMRHMSGFGFGGSFSDDMMNGTQGNSNDGDPVIKDIYVTYYDICHGIKDRPIKYTYKAVCEKCHGQGGDDVIECAHCHGTGILISSVQRGNTIWQQRSVCPHCHGKGKTIRNTCDHCHGTGTIDKEDIFNITVPTEHLVLNKAQLYVGDFGSEPKNANGQRGPLIFVVNHSLPPHMCIVQGAHGEYHVVHTIELPYYDMILGTKKEVLTPSGKKIRINIPNGTNDGDICRACGQGFDINGIKGDYNVIVKMKPLPKTLSSTEKKNLEKIKEIIETK